MENTILFEWETVDSSWLSRISYLYVSGEKGVGVEFKDGTQVFYPDTTVEDYSYLKNSPSKGKAIWRRFYDKEYELI